MADPFGFIKYQREESPRPRDKDLSRGFRETGFPLRPHRLEHQAERCIDCGIPFCEIQGCPARNRIPDWIAMAGHDKWKEALELLHSTNNFPEFTGRLCPASCETACILSIGHTPVTIRRIELEIAERGWKEGWVVPEPPLFHTGKKIAVVGSGPSGLAAAQQLVRAGHTVTVFDRDDRVGGILRYGIPDFVLEKWVLDRRIDQMIGEGAYFETSVNVGVDLSIGYLRRTFDVVIVLTGSRIPRDIQIPGRELSGIHYALEFLSRQNRRTAGDNLPDDTALHAGGKRVTVIGGGETGEYCVETIRLQGASEIVQLDIAPETEPGNERLAWPFASENRAVAPSPDDGCVRLRGLLTREFSGKDGAVNGLVLEPAAAGASVETSPVLREITGGGFALDTDMVILALGFAHVERGPLVSNLSLETDEKGNLLVDEKFMTSSAGVFAGGDCVLGGTSVIWAINQGRRVAEAVDRYLS